MPVELVHRTDKETVFRVHEPTRYGMPDNSWDVAVKHDPKTCQELKIITRERINNLADTRGETEKIQLFDIANVGQVVFLLVYDHEDSSATYRQGMHDVKGPFLLTD